MPFTIAVAGKGGTGKTTLSALLVQALRARGDGPVLAVDADPNANLGEQVGLEVERSIGELREDTLSRVADLPPGASKERHLEQGLHECLVEGKGLDLLVMGRGEGPKCYCMVNHILRKYIEVLRGSYAYVVLDNEAGLEHLSRRTTQDVDALLVVSQLNPVALRAAGRIVGLARELDLRVDREYLVLNGVSGDMPSSLEVAVRETGIALGGVVPHDEGIAQLALEGRPLRELSEGSPARNAAGELLDMMLSERNQGG
ncbi:MAG: AAA family ATPase [Candidatus Bipolaricaulota bacterium]